MEWTVITSPTDFPPQRVPVLISDGENVGMAYRRDIEKKDADRHGFRSDGWIMLWPADPDQKFKPKKWGPLPSA